MIVKPFAFCLPSCVTGFQPVCRAGLHESRLWQMKTKSMLYVYLINNHSQDIDIGLKDQWMLRSFKKEGFQAPQPECILDISIYFVDLIVYSSTSNKKECSTWPPLSSLLGFSINLVPETSIFLVSLPYSGCTLPWFHTTEQPPCGLSLSLLHICISSPARLSSDLGQDR